MSASYFRLTDGLIGNVPQAAAQGQNTMISNWILENPIPTIPKTNSTLDSEQIALLITAIDIHYRNAIKASNTWQNGDATKDQPAINDLVIDVLNGFVHFTQQFPESYKKIIKSAYHKDEKELKNQLTRTQRLLEQLINGANGTITAIKNYERDLVADQADFNKDYDHIMSEIGDVSKVITGLKTSITSLQQDIENNNSEVLNTFIDTLGTELVQGTSLFTSAASEDVGGAVSAGVQMGVALIEGIIKTIQLNEKTLADIKKIRTLSMEVDEDDVILTVLVNIGTKLVGLGGEQGIQLNIIGDIINYWSTMSSGINDLLENHANDLSSQIDIVNYSPETEHFRNPVFPPWNVILPIEKASTTFSRILKLTPEVFDNDTNFGPLPK
jgi:hypothetical protein